MTTWLAIAEFAYIVTISCWILLEKRPPAATIAWILTLALLPGLGFVIYWLMGPRRLQRVRSRRERAHDRLQATSGHGPRAGTFGAASLVSGLDGPERQLVTLALNNGEAPVSRGNHVEVLRNGHACYDRLEAAIRGARHHVHFEYYIVENDRTGRRFRDLLVEKAREGVEVRLLVDALGSRPLDDRFFGPLKAAGAEIGWFNPVLLRWVTRPNFRNHRKIVVVDGAVAFTGGINIGDEYLGLGETGAWRDTHLALTGPAAHGLQALFIEDWNFATGRSLVGPAYFAPLQEADGGALVQVVGSGPDQDFEVIHHLFFTAIGAARERARITTPYFVPDDATTMALVTAALRGVDVDVLVPWRTDARLVSAASRSYYDELLAAGVRLHEYRPGFLHAKTMVVDGRFAVVGSANFDQRSFRLNFEVAAVVYDAAVAATLDTQFEKDLALSREITPDERATRSLGSRLAEASARILSPLL